MGLFADAAYEEGEMYLESGDLIGIFSDGVYEAHNSDGDEFGEERILEILAKNPDGRCAELRDAVLDDVRSFAGGDLGDDATALLVRYQAP